MLPSDLHCPAVPRVPQVSAPRLTRLAYRMREAERERAVETAALQGKVRPAGRGSGDACARRCPGRFHPAAGGRTHDHLAPCLQSRERAACLAKLWQRREAAEARLVKADAALLAAAAARE